MVTVCFFQGAYFVLTGTWPLIDSRSFQRVTGPKVDLWLVKTVAVLITVIGGVLLIAAWRQSVSIETGMLAMGSSLGLISIDVTYTIKRTISPIYLCDAAAEAVLVAAWVFLIAAQGFHRPE